MWPGDPYPLGATWTGVGVNFALFSAHATKVELCLFDAPDATVERARIPLPEQTDMVWHGFLPTPDRTSSTVTACTARTSPARATVSTPTKIVMDPYAKSVARTIRWADEMFGYTRRRSRRRPLVRRPRQRGVRAARRRGRSGVHVGRRPAAAHAVAQHGHLRDARARLLEAASRIFPSICAAPTKR